MKQEIARSCEVCSSRKYEKIFKENDNILVKCRDCGFVFINPIFVGTEASFYQEYHSLLKNVEHYEILYNSSKNIQYENVLNIVSKYYPKDSQLLDFGGGLGYFCRKAGDFGFDAYNCDISEPSIRFSREVLKNRNSFCQFENIPVAKFDIITMLDVLEHVENPRKILVQMMDKLQQGGLLVVQVPSWDYYRFLALSVFHRFKKKSGLILNTHLQYFTFKTLALLLASCGFEIVEKRIAPPRYFSNRLLNKVKSVNYSLNKLLLLKLTRGRMITAPGIIVIARKGEA